MHDVPRAFLFLCTLLLIWSSLTFSITCLNLLGVALWPGKARASRALLEQSLGRCLLVGLVFFLGTLMLLSVSKGNPVLGLVALLVVGFLVWQLVGALPGIASYVGEALAEGPVSRARAVIVGTLVICAGGALPWVGWAILIVLLATCCGSGVLSALRGMRSQSRKPAPPTGERAPISQA